MKNFLFSVFAIVLFAFNGNAQSIDDLRKSNNPLNFKGENFYNYLKDVQKSILENKTDLDKIKNEINNDNFNFKINLSENDLILYENYFKERIINLENILVFENEIINSSINNSNQILLESIAILKWSIFFHTENSKLNSISGFENCLNNCLEKKAKALFEDGNWVEQAEFMLSGGVAFAWWVASCTWTCRKS